MKGFVYVERVDKISMGGALLINLMPFRLLSLNHLVLRVFSKIPLPMASAIARLVNTLFRHGGW